MSGRQATHNEGGDPVKRQQQYHAALMGGLKGASGGFAVGVPTAYILNRSWQPFRQLTIPLKAFFVTMITVSSGVIAGDKAGIAFERGTFRDTGANVAKQYRSQEEKEWEQLSTRDKALTWAKENKFSVVAASWVASMAGSFAYIQTQPLSFSQRLVQARVYAQGLTLLSLVGMAAISAIPSAGDKIIEQHNHASEHSWKDMLGEMEKADAEKKQGGEQKGQKVLHGQSGTHSKSSHTEKSDDDKKKDDKKSSESPKPPQDGQSQKSQ